MRVQTIEQLEEALAKWIKKLKLARTKVRKLKAKISYRKKKAELDSFERLMPRTKAVYDKKLLELFNDANHEIKGE